MEIIIVVKDFMVNESDFWLFVLIVWSYVYLPYSQPQGIERKGSGERSP